MNLAAMDTTAVLLSSLISFAIGALWLSPALFGNLWLKSLNIPPHDYSLYINGRTYCWLAAFVAGLNAGISVVVDLMGYSNMREGIYGGIYMWVIFIIPQFAVFERRPIFLYAIYSGYFLVMFVISSALFAMWR
jgi:hypothetical protein